MLSEENVRILLDRLKMTYAAHKLQAGIWQAATQERRQADHMKEAHLAGAIDCCEAILQVERSNEVIDVTPPAPRQLPGGTP